MEPMDTPWPESSHKLNCMPASGRSARPCQALGQGSTGAEISRIGLWGMYIYTHIIHIYIYIYIYLSYIYIYIYIQQFPPKE